MQRSVFFALAVLCLTFACAAVASAQTVFYCVKPGGAPVAGIVVPSGDRHDPSVICNAMVKQCFLTCSAVARRQDGQATVPAGLPMITVTPQMLSSLGSPSFESREQCEREYQQCLARCRGDRACRSYCQSVRSGCGTGNTGR